MWVFVVDTDLAVAVCICHKFYLFNIITVYKPELFCLSYII